MRRTVIVGLFLLGAMTGGCGGEDEEGIVVFAAASLPDAFVEAGKAFEGTEAGVPVRFSFASSSALAVQINEGAPADVFASANEEQMEAVVSKGNAAEARVFATNHLAIVVASGVEGVNGLEGLGRPGLKLVVAARDVPAGKYAREAIAKGRERFGAEWERRVLGNVRSEEPNVRAVLTKVELGEADAGIVYVSDIEAPAGGVRAAPIGEAFDVVARYPVAVVTGSGQRAAAARFVEFLLSAEGQRILRQHGFGAPP
ncbi:MAG: molybdate ABC transporter substrate-binding protein [Tepidiformaceae bacterium]